MIDHYDWESGREAMLRFGPATGPVVVTALPLFEEANRTRTFVVTILRALAERGIAGALPDLPGQGESLYPLQDASILTMQCAYERAVDHIEREGRVPYGLGIRSGAILDRLALLHGRWYLTPQDGQQLLRELNRVKQVEIGHARKLGEDWYFEADVPEGGPVEIAGNLIGTALLTDLSVKEPWKQNGTDDPPLRVVRLEGDMQPADLKVSGAPLWRRAEPDNDPALAELVADDIAAWVRACEG